VETVGIIVDNVGSLLGIFVAELGELVNDVGIFVTIVGVLVPDVGDNVCPVGLSLLDVGILVDSVGELVICIHDIDPASEYVFEGQIITSVAAVGAFA